MELLCIPCHHVFIKVYAEHFGYNTKCLAVNNTPTTSKGMFASHNSC